VEVKRTLDGNEINITRLGVGTFFGEQALVTQAPRMAFVVAIGPVECLRLDKPSFEVLMGPCEEALAANAQLYEQEATKARVTYAKAQRSKTNSLEGEAGSKVSCTTFSSPPIASHIH
jgi:CRP-like cAMP-binding protein